MPGNVQGKKLLFCVPFNVGSEKLVKASRGDITRCKRETLAGRGAAKKSMAVSVSSVKGKSAVEMSTTPKASSQHQVGQILQKKKKTSVSKKEAKAPHKPWSNFSLKGFQFEVLRGEVVCSPSSLQD